MIWGSRFMSKENLAKIVKKIIFNIAIETKSPLRISSGQDDGITDILVLKNKEGRAFIPGTSLTGVLRAKMSGIYSTEAMDKLFGNISDDGNQSMINISDIVLDNAKIVNRDGIKIDSLTGVSEKGAKFDFELIDKGATGNLTIEVTIRQKALKEEYKPTINYVDAHKDLNFAVNGDVYEDMLATLADVLTEGVSVGALTTKGYGKIKSIEPVKMYVFDFTKDHGAVNWWNYIDKKQLPKPLYIAKSNISVVNKADFIMQLDFALTSSMIIRDYDADVKEDNIGAVQLKCGDDYVIPATSIKGVLKSRAYNIFRILNCFDDKYINKFIDKLMGKETDKENENDKGQKSRLYIDEVYVKPDVLISKNHSRNRIDRFTGGTINGALFTDKPIWQVDKNKATIKMNLRVQECEEQEAGLMLLLMKDLWLGNLSIGGNKAIGRGVLKGQKCTIRYAGESFFIEENEAFCTSENIERLENYVQKLSGDK